MNKRETIPASAVAAPVKIGKLCPLPKPHEVDFVIYHAECQDGLGAAWAARRLLGADGVTYLPYRHQTPPPDVTGRHVALVDFSFRRPHLEQMLEQAQSLVIVDHHDTMREDLEGLDNVIFDVTHSGCVLAWKWFHPDDEVPGFLRYIEDRDLWKWELPHSHEINAGLRSHPWTFEQFDTYLSWAVSEVTDLATEGRAILRFQAQVVADHVAGAVNGTLRVPMSLGYRTYPATFVHATSRFFSSEIGNILTDADPDRIAVLWHAMPEAGGIRFELRSHRSHLAHLGHDIGTPLGGGGHAHAAGFRLFEPRARGFHTGDTPLTFWAGDLITIDR